MSTLSAPLTAGATLPTLTLVSPTGEPTSLDAFAASSPTVLYLMRTATCPVCHQHLRHLARMAAAGEIGVPLVIVPGDASEAASVERRHPALAGRIVASETAHAALGLFVRMGLQQSGTYVVDGGRVLYARYATVPVGSFDASETVAAVRNERS
jgi:peroxiredoxin